MTPDSRAQIMQIYGEIPYDNENPLLTTLFVGFWIKLGELLLGNISAGLGLYTFVQFTLAAAVFAYTVFVIYKHSGSRIKALVAHVFYNFIPYNIVYSATMWKDTLFALLFLTTITYIWDCVICDKNQRKNLRIVFLLVLITSLLRNSGWSSLLILGAIMALYIKRNPKCKLYTILNNIAKTIVGSVTCALVVITVVYPLCGITDNGSVVVGLSVPIQQVSSVVVSGHELSTRDYNLIDDVIEFDMQEFDERYDPHISDPVKFNIDTEVLENNFWEYCKMWVRLGLKHPKLYLDAYIGLMGRFWDFEFSDWLWDAGIRDNNFGIERKSIFLNGMNLADELTILARLPNTYVLQNSAIIFWSLILSIGYANIRKNRIAEIILFSVLMIYVGLFITAPVANFRYIYAAAVCAPLNMLVVNNCRNAE